MSVNSISGHMSTATDSRLSNIKYRQRLYFLKICVCFLGVTYPSIIAALVRSFGRSAGERGSVWGVVVDVQKSNNL